MSQEYASTAPGRPKEIEEPLNHALVHPVARALVDRLVRTSVTPNQVSVASLVAGLGAAACVLKLAWPWTAIGGALFLLAWHILDGADGDLARRTGRASPIGELVDGVCDHASQVAVYVALALALQREIGGVEAWWAACLAGGSHAIQSNAYETARKTYRHYVYGAPWMRQARTERGLGGVLSAGYMAISRALGPGEDQAAEAMAQAQSHLGVSAARALYRDQFQPIVKRAGWLGATGRTLALTASLLAGSALWYFVWEITVLNAVLAWMIWARGRANRTLSAKI